MAGLHTGISSNTKAKVCFDAVFEWAYKAKAITPKPIPALAQPQRSSTYHLLRVVEKK